MQIEHKTEKGTVLFVKVPDDAIAFNFYMGYLTYKVYNPKAMCNDDLLANPYMLTKFLERTENISEYINGTPIKIDEKFQLIGLTSEITEEQANMMVGIGEVWGSLRLLKSLMQHLQVYEVNPLPDPENTMRQGDGYVYYGASDEEFEEYARVEEQCGHWIVLFKPNT